MSWWRSLSFIDRFAVVVTAATATAIVSLSLATVLN
jgi:hypothetical protein